MSSNPPTVITSQDNRRTRRGRTLQTQTSPMHRATTLAIIGCGPRGLQCLETLQRKVPAERFEHLQIVIFDSSTHLGAGAVYAPDQPHQLRMNFATQHIDFWKVRPDQRTRQSRSLIGWLRRHHPQWAESHQYVPRAVVGEYLSECFDTVFARFAPGQVKIHRQQVTDIVRVGSAWQLKTDESWFGPFDEVVITTGHEGLRPKDQLANQHSSSNHSSVLKSRHTATIFPLPVEKNLTHDKVPPHARILIRGFGLTAIDAILSLTEGRGGLFTNDDPIPVYVKSFDEPATMQVISRSGRPMLAKPTATVEPISDSFWQPYRERLNARRANHGSLDFHRDIWSVITEAAASLFNSDARNRGHKFSGRPTTPPMERAAANLAPAPNPLQSRDVEDWFRGFGRNAMDAETAQRAMFRSYEVAQGRRPKDIPFVLGEAWRKLYPSFVELVSYGGLAEHQWMLFQRLACEMERIAFGPPAQSVGKLLALLDCGLLSLSNYHDPSNHQSDDFDCVIDAVIAGPHDAKLGGPLQRLVANGQIRLDPPSGALMVDKAGRPIDGPSSLAIFGRTTEGWVVGNDTLTRTLHSQIELWGESLAAKL